MAVNNIRPPPADRLRGRQAGGIQRAEDLFSVEIKAENIYVHASTILPWPESRQESR